MCCFAPFSHSSVSFLFSHAVKGAKMVKDAHKETLKYKVKKTFNKSM